MAIVFNLIRSTILNILRALNSTRESCMFPLLVVLVLGNTRIHICALNGSNLASHIEGSVNEYFGNFENPRY